MEITEIIKGVKQPILDDVNRIVEAVKNDSKATASDLEKQLSGKIEQAFEKASSEAKGLIEKNETEFRKRLEDYQNKQSQHLSFGEQLMKSLTDNADLLKGFAEGNNNGKVANVTLTKTPSPATVIAPGFTGGNTAAGLHNIYTNEAIVAIPRRQRHIRDIFGMGSTDIGTFPYLREIAAVGAAAAQNPEGAAKAQVQNNWELVTETESTIAAFQRVGRQTLSNVRGLASMINMIMVNDLLILEDNELLNGTASNGRVRGIIPGAVAPSTPFDLKVAGPQNYDVIAACAAQLAKNEFLADFALLNPVDYWAMVTSKDKDENYLQNVVFDSQASSLFVFGIPVYATTAITAGNYVVGDSRYVMPMQREGLSLRVSEEDGTNFRENVVTIRVEERILQAVTRLNAFYAGSLATAKTAITPAT